MQYYLDDDDSQRPAVFNATEVASYDYCPLVWWNEQYEPLVHTDNDELFATLVELEHEHGTQATTLPEYQVIEQILIRRGAFTTEDEPTHTGDGFAEDDADELYSEPLVTGDKLRKLQVLAVSTLTIALLFLLVAWITAAFR
jgi:hypothetical protein